MTKNFAIKTRDPRNPENDVVEIIIPGDLIEHYYCNMPVQYENFRVAKTVLESPRRIFSGLRAFNEGGWCYVGRPASWYIRENTIVTFPGGFVFAVYINPRFMLYDFRAEKADPEDTDSPVDWAGRYGALVWKSIS